MIALGVFFSNMLPLVMLLVSSFISNLYIINVIKRKVEVKYINCLYFIWIHKNGRHGTFNPNYRGGSDPIHLDNVVCKGYEVDIDDCQHNDWNVNDCSHGEDAGVTCKHFS